MRVRQVQQELQELMRRGFGDEEVLIQVGGAGRVTEVKVIGQRVWLKTSDEA